MNQRLLELLESPPTRRVAWNRTDGVRNGNGLTYRLYDLTQADPETITAMQKTLKHARTEGVDSVALAEQASHDLGATVSPADLATVEPWDGLIPVVTVLDYDPLVTALTDALRATQRTKE